MDRVIFLPEFDNEKNSLPIFPDADNYSCEVWDYQRGHSVLAVRAKHTDNSLVYNFQFDTTVYFKGSLNWYGARISVATREETMKYAMQHSLFPKLQADFLSVSLRLVHFDVRDGGEVNVIANTLSIKDG